MPPSAAAWIYILSPREAMVPLLTMNNLSALNVEFGSVVTATSAAAVTLRALALATDGLNKVMTGVILIDTGNCHSHDTSDVLMATIAPSAPTTPAFCAGAVPYANVLA